jgi:protein gp37
MSDGSAIEWTDATWNPVTGCSKVSPGCKHCYAERFAERFRGVAGHPFEQGFDLRIWNERLDIPLRWKRPRRIFVNSMSDLFHPKVPEDFIQDCFNTMVKAEWHQFQILTKRPERAVMLAESLPWPENVWLGTSIETEDYIGRIKSLAATPAQVRFLSCEPLLGPLDLKLDNIHWVIVGGESGPGARPIKPEWVQSIRDQCSAKGVAFFFKQWGGVVKSKSGRNLDGTTHDAFPRGLTRATA